MESGNTPAEGDLDGAYDRAAEQPHALLDRIQRLPRGSGEGDSRVGLGEGEAPQARERERA